MEKGLLFKGGIDSISAMPIIKSAQKALRQTHKRTAANLKKKNTLKRELKEVKKGNKKEKLNTLYSLVDKMVKTGVIHKNKANRLKSRWAKSS
ncbi:MAG: 30S ribosomal protein S20 [Patescibacteria group bacterium]|nr:30S ribosomal protein S20 [Patescibacteria group bacterium]